MYEGDWLKDHKHGYGILSKISKDGNIRKVYAGNWVEGKKHGFGSNWYRDGSYYEGTFRENKRNGYGQIWYKCGSRYYQGTWSNDHYHGEGIFIQGTHETFKYDFAKNKFLEMFVIFFSF